MKPRLKITIQDLNGVVPVIIRDLEGVENAEAKDNILFVTCESNIRSKVITKLEDAGFKIIDIKTIEPSLEDAFVKLIEGDT